MTTGIMGINKMKLLKWSTVLMAFLFAVLAVGCKNDNDRATLFFENFFSNNWDTCKVYLQEPINRDLVRILNSQYKLKGSYDFSVDSKMLVFGLQNAKDRDTIFLQLNESTEKLMLDSISVLKLFNHEDEIRQKMSSYYLQKREDDKVLQWITFGDTIKDEGFLGEMYYWTSKYGEAEKHLKRALLKGYPKAVVFLGDIYTLAGDRDRAIKMLKEAANNSNSEAMQRLGDFYSTYDDPEFYEPPDDANDGSSFYWYKRAAQLGNTFAMYHLGNIYANGMNKEENLDSAYYWYKKGSDLGGDAATIEIARFYLEGNYFEQNIDSGLFLLNKVVHRDPSTGYFELGTIYEEGIGVEQDKKLALQYYLKADSVGYSVVHLAIKRVKAELKKTEELN